MARKKSTEQQTGQPQGTLGQRIATLRKQNGLTQVELAKKMGLSQVLICHYERGRLRPNPEIIIKLAQNLKVSTDELLGVKPSPTNGYKLSLKTLRRLQKIEALPSAQQKALLKNIDMFLKGAEVKG